jgi:hypothetical protein
MKVNYYEILGVSPQASFDIIHAAWRALMLKGRKHPDLGGDPEEAKAINEAYDVLKDAEKRSRYDSRLGRTSIWKFWQKPQPQSTERRRAVRTAINTTVSFCLNHDTCWNAARVKDYSIIGLRLVSHEPIRKNESIVISCANTASQVVHGTVKWVRMYCPSIFERVYEAGIEFDSPVPDIAQRLSI